MPIDLAALVSRWTRSTNRRVVFEEMLRAFGWLAIAGVTALALHRLPWLLGRFRISWPSWLPTSETMAILAYSLVGLALVAVTARAVVRILRRRIDTLAMARRIDEQQGTEDLVATALAVTAGTVAGSADVQQVVHDRAQTAVAKVSRPLPRFAAPGRVLAGAGVLTAAAIALPLFLDDLVALTISDAVAAVDDPDAEAEQEVTPLDEQTQARIDKAIEQLKRYEDNKGLRRDAKEQLAAAREHLQRAIDDPKQAAASLSRAEQALRKLAKEARRQGLFDNEELSKMSNEELTDTMSKAMEEGQHDTASEMGSELARRMENASESELRKMAEAFRKRFPPTSSPKMPERTPPGESGEKKPGESGESGEKKPGESGESGEKKPGESGESGEKKPGESGEKKPGESGESGEGKRETAEERRERWRKALEEMAEDMERGESGLSSSEMRRLAEELAEEADRGNGSMGRSLDETLEGIRGARRRHLDELGRERGEGKPGEGKAPGMGKPGEGKSPGMGKPGEGKGPGMGKPGEGKGPGTGEGKGPGEGKGSGEGKSGEGKSGEGKSGEGPPSGKPGPGGGLGRTPYRLGVLPPGFTPGERVDVPSGGPPKGAVCIIERAASGPGRDTKEYADIHHEYSAVAEAAVRREEIPLTRRDYIRNYFQAVRPQ